MRRIFLLPGGHDLFSLFHTTLWVSFQRCIDRNEAMPERKRRRKMKAFRRIVLLIQPLAFHQLRKKATLRNELVIVPSSMISPLSSTRMRSQFRMVDRRWATTMRVHFSRSSASDTCFWVLLSRAEVASSKIRIAGLGATACAIIRRCFCPPEIPPCPSEMIVCIPMGISRMSSAIPAISAASQASFIVSYGAEITMLE